MRDILSALPFLLILACPLMMIFMMKGMNHGGHEKHVDHDASEHQPPSSSPSREDLHALRERLAVELGQLDARLETLEHGQSEAKTRGSSNTIRENGDLAA